MANRYIRNLVILAERETTYATDPTPLPAANAILVSEANINPFNAQNVPRDLIRAYFGASEHLVGVAYIEMDFTVELAGSGTAPPAGPALASAPAWGPLARACMMAEALEIGYASYTPLTDSQDSCTLYWYDSGVLHIARGCRGNMELMAKVTERPRMKFMFKGLLGTYSAAAVPTPTLTMWTKPVVVTDTNTDDLILGATLTTGALSGGTAYPSTGLELNLGNQVEFTPLVGAETVDGVDREATGKVEFDLTAAQEVSFAADVVANVTRAISMEHGQTAGNIVIVHAPAAQLLNWRKAEINKKRLIGYDLRFVPNVGNDELTIIVK